MQDRFSSDFPPREAAQARSAHSVARVFPLWPERWQVVCDDRERPLWISPGKAPFYRSCVGQLICDRSTALRAQAMLTLHRVIPRARLLTEFRLPRGLRRVLSFDFAVRGRWRAAIRMGTAGPRQKASVVIATDAGEDIAFARVAITPAADRRIAAEAENLRRLAAMPHLAGQVPRLLADGTTLAGRRYFVTTLAPGPRRCSTLTPGHLRFLATLARARPATLPFRASPCLRRIEVMLARLQSHVDRDTRFELWEALRECAVQLADWTGPYVVAHGEFAPRNIAPGRENVFVCDWEKVRSGANPLTDVLSFLAAARPGALKNAGRFSTAVCAVGERMREIHPQHPWPYAVVAALTLAWLIERVLQHCLEDECGDAGNVAIRSHWRLIQARNAWLAPL